MRIVIDLQGAQNESRFRGIGRYTMALSKAIVENKGSHEIIIALNGAFPESINQIRKVFKGLLPQENIRVWLCPTPVLEGQQGNDWRREVSEIMREYYLESLQPDVVWVSSLFEGYVDNAVTSVRKSLCRHKVAITLYDLIPLINPESYLTPNPSYAQHYRRKIEYLKAADLWLPISESSKEEGIEYLGLPSEHVVNISSACDEVFLNKDTSHLHVAECLINKGIKKKFIFYTGAADSRKNLKRLVCAFALLPESIRDSYQLVLAGKMHPEGVAEIESTAHKKGLKEEEVIVLGYISDEEMLLLYRECTIFIFPSLHEGFGLPALEAMACGAVVITSNVTSLPEVVGRPEAMFDPYDVNSISRKIFEVLTDPKLYQELQNNSRERVRMFSWDQTAQKAIKAFEEHVLREVSEPCQKVSVEKVIAEIDNITNKHSPTEKDLVSIAYALSKNLPAENRSPKLYLDISELVIRDLGTGIQRVSRSVAKIFYENGIPGYEVVPVYADHSHLGYKTANFFFHKTAIENEVEGEPIEAQSGDIFLGLDLQHLGVINQYKYLQHLHHLGVRIYYVVYDLLPITMSDFYWAEIVEAHEKWLRAVTQFDGAICISKSVSDELSEWIETNCPDKKQSFSIKWFHLGADINNSIPSQGLDANSEKVIEQLKSSDTFLMVGTVEPRKGQDQVLDAFEVLWSQGHSINLVIVGKQGWMVDKLAERLREHPQRNKQLFWLEGISDEYLGRIYESSTCLIAASRGEGFGLPLIEAAQHKLPIIARDILVFREVAGEHASYFSSLDSQGLAKEINTWLELYKAGKHAKPDEMPWLTWEQSAVLLKEILLGSKPIKVHSEDASAV